MSCYPSLETHPLKVIKSIENLSANKVILGPPDVYQQEPKQKEDLLSEFNVREGFNCTKAVADEHESGKDLGIDFVSRSFLSDINNYMQAVIVKNHNMSIIPEKSEKRKAATSAMFKDLLSSPVIEKSKEITYEWMSGLCDTVPYAELINKRIPTYPKKDDVLKEIYRYQVPITRAIWFIKVSTVVENSKVETIKKKKPCVDNHSEWSQVLSRVLSEKLDLVAEKLASNSLDHEYELCIAEFEYLLRLMVAMYDEDLLDHTEVLQWLVSRCDRCDEPLMQFYLPFLLEFGDRFKESEILTRRLVFWACRAFNSLICDEKFGIQRSLTDYYSEYSHCAMHRKVIFCLSGIITSLSLMCPSAVVWNNVKVPDHYLNGSPLDALPCSLTALPSPPGPENETIRDALAKLEQFVMERSLLVEKQWKHESFDSDVEQTANSLIKILDILDRYDYNYCKEQNAIETLAGTVLAALEDKRLLLLLLCEWATTSSRTGLHRPIVAVHVIEQLRQKSEQPLQATLVLFLDTKAPCVETATSMDLEPFRNLVCLFGELIERELFSLDDYVSYMIKRGLFEQCAHLPLPPIGGPTPDPDPDRNSVDNPDSVRSECSGLAQPHPVMANIDYRQLGRHLQYLAHFPIPNNEDYVHEHNLRAQKLYWSTRTRDANRQFIKRLVKDVSRFFNKRSNMFDVVQMEKPRKKPRKDSRDDSLLLDRLTESILFRFKSLTFFDMELVMSQCVQTIVNSFNIAALLTNKNQSMSNLYLPYPKLINVLLSMIELSCNYGSLIQTIEECLVNLWKLIEHLTRSNVLGNGGAYLATYCSHFRMYVIGFLVKYQSVLMVMNESRNKIFHTLFFMVYSTTLNTGNTPSYIIRCTYGLIHTLYQSCALIKSQRVFLTLSKKVFRVVEPDRARPAGIGYEEGFAVDLIKGSAMPSSERYSLVIHEMQNSAVARLSFVVNCVLHIARCQDADSLIRVNTMVVETAANVNAMPTELMTALFSLLMPFNALPGYAPFKDLFSSFLCSSDMTFFENIALLIATLLARQCFTFCDFLSRVICVAMAQGLEQQSPVSAEIVPTTRLASYVLHRLFTIESTVPPFANIGPFKLEDVNLLTSSLQKVTTELLVDLLKMLAVHSDKGRLQDNDGRGTPLSAAENDENFASMKIWNLTLRVLREICCVSWVRIKFSMETPSRLIRENVLIDKNISHSQARNLLSIICQPREHVWQATCSSRDIIDTMVRTLEHLDLWSLHFDQMKVQLLLTQIPDEDRKEIVECVARDTIGLFQSQAEQQQDDGEEAAATVAREGQADADAVSVEIPSAYLIPPLVHKLPFDQLKRQLVAAAAERLEGCKHFSSHKNYQDKGKDLTKSSLVLACPPFVSLLVFCLGRDDHKHDFLRSLADQIEYYIENAKETEKMPDDLRVKHLIHTSLRARLALVGYLFDRIQESAELSGDWSLLLSRLIIHGVVELQSDHSALFYTVLDMIGTLLHTLFAQQGVGSKFNVQLCRKLRKDISEKLTYEGVELIKPFLHPCFRNTYDIVVTVPLRMPPPRASQQQRLTASERSGKQGCAVLRKERLSPWEVIDGVKSLFSLSWFAAVACGEGVLLPIEEQAPLLIGHDHPDRMLHSDDFFTAPPALPHEDVPLSGLPATTADALMDQGGPPSAPPSLPDAVAMVPVPASASVSSEAVQPLQRSHSNASTASSEVSASKRTTKRAKRAPPSAAMQPQTQMPPAMILRNPAGMFPQGYPMEYQHNGYLPPGIGDVHQQQQTFLQQQRAAYPQAGGGLLRGARLPRSNVVTQNLKTKLQQRQPPQEMAPGMHPSFHGGPPQSIGPPPPYPGSSSQGPLDDMASYQLQRQYQQDQHQFMLHQQQQQSRIHQQQQQFSRFNSQY